jgi:molybdate transport system regulatory protein
MQLRLRLGANTSFGPGKADLLESIRSTGSISAAARAMRMSYKRAWQLIDEMNRSFASPLVDTAKGGVHGGGAALTDCGRRVVASYRALQQKAYSAAKGDLQVLAELAAEA